MNFIIFLFLLSLLNLTNNIISKQQSIYLLIVFYVRNLLLNNLFSIVFYIYVLWQYNTTAIIDTFRYFILYSVQKLNK